MPPRGATRHRHQADTRRNLLEAAGRVFAAEGYRNATVRQICRLAKANIAAVSYHFGDKKGLYKAVLGYAGTCAMETHPIGADDPARPAEERLGAFIRNYLARLLDEGRPAWHGQLIAREMFEPTSALDHIARQFARPQYERLRAIIGELLGPGATPEQIRLSCCSVVGQCLFYKHARPMIQRLMPEQGYTARDRDALASHITAFSLGAISAARQAGGAR